MSPRTKKQNEVLRSVAREKIMAAALELFGTKGYKATSIHDIAKRAGVSKGLVYHYFSGKEDLVIKMVEGLMQKNAHVLDLVSDKNPKTMLGNIFTLFFRELRENFHNYYLLYNMSHEINGVDFVHAIAVQKMNKQLELFIQLLGDIGWEDPVGDARLLLATLDGIGRQYLVFQQDYPMDEIEKTLFNKYCKP
ncbi:MAG: TetR/AcrR family transcriptional regulator [Cyclobacteriaceae bacterium]|nr:TetR/AcrR family transcriptional regulator [Cyclobacteriaceae bacterium]